MGIEAGTPIDFILEDASAEEDEVCGACEGATWLRLIAAYVRGGCYVIFCAGCGKPLDSRWTIVP